MTRRRERSWLIILASLYLSIIGAFLIFMSRERNTDLPRHHIYFCQHPESGLSLPCMYRKNDPVNV